MTIIVENGSGIAGASTYADVAFADAYFTDRPHLAISTTWSAATTANKEGALREATAYVDGTYGQSYRGIRSGYVQALLWPRTGANDDAGYPLPNLPPELVSAVCELAARALTSPLASDAKRGGRVKRNKVDGAVEQEFFDGAPVETRFGVVQGMLAPILDGTQANIPQWNWY